MAPRGLKTAIASGSGKLVKNGKFSGFRATDSNGKPTGPLMRGITKLLETRLYSDAELPTECFGFSGWKAGGLARGRAIDAQVSRLASASASKRESQSKYKLTTLAFHALKRLKLEPLCGQRVVAAARRNLATAADVIAYNPETHALVVVELKTGYSGPRTLACASPRGTPRKMQPPLSRATDCVLHRHMAQLTVTRALLLEEREFKDILKRYDLSTEGVLLYVDQEKTELHTQQDWWTKRGKTLLDRIT